MPSDGEIKAFAKINLHLRVLNKRDDGYHNIISLMATVGLYDLLKLERIDYREKGFQCCIHSRGGIHESVIASTPTESNLMYKAAARYCEEAGIQGRFDFGIEKNIPAGGGLGGGSADAAAVLRIMNDTFGRFGEDRLREIGAAIGADVPFCINGGMAICEGKGEVIQALQGKCDHAVIIANDGIHVDTAAAYRSLGRNNSLPFDPEVLAAEKRKITDAVESGSLETIAADLVNDFEEPIFRNHPGIKMMKEMLYADGAFFAAMTGSGSSVIALFKNYDVAGTAEAAALDKRIKSVTLTGFA